MRKILAVALSALLIISTLPAEAKRIGGGRSVGRQSSHVIQRHQQAAPVAPGQRQGTAAHNQANRQGQSTAPNAANTQRRPWAGMLGGLAAGLGLAWLASQLGLGEGFANILLIMLLAAGGLWLWRKLRGQGVQSQRMAYQGAGYAPVAPAGYNSKNVGNDASARPWEAAPTAFATNRAGGGSMIGSSLASGADASALSGSQNWGVPAGFDTAGFLAAAKRNFITLQAAWDKADVGSLRTMMTDEMLAEITAQLAEREQQAGTLSPQTTEFGMLDAQLLGIEETEHDYLASVEFSGMVREDVSDANMTPFREVWNMSKPKAGGGWLVAGVQALS